MCQYPDTDTDFIGAHYVTKVSSPLKFVQICVSFNGITKKQLYTLIDRQLVCVNFTTLTSQMTLGKEKFNWTRSMLLPAVQTFIAVCWVILLGQYIHTVIDWRYFQSIISLVIMILDVLINICRSI